MKTILTLLLAAAAFCVQAADNPTKKPVLSGFAVESFATVKSDLVNEDTSYGFGVSYYITESLGARVRTSFDELSGHTFENVSVHGLWRVPIALGRHSLYAFGGAERTFHGKPNWAIQAGPGYSYALPFLDGVVVSAELGFEKIIDSSQREPTATATISLGYAF